MPTQFHGCQMCDAEIYWYGATGQWLHMATRALFCAGKTHSIATPKERIIK